MADSNMDGIDLYADVDDFGREQSDNFHETDLYDDVITSRHETTEEPVSKPVAQTTAIPTAAGVPKKTYSLYVANLTWWTSDQDLQDALASIGISDLVNIRFHENRTNGQSKGFATVVVGSETSSHIIQERLIHKDIHGMLPTVLHCTKANLERLDPMPRKDAVGPSGTNSSSQRQGGASRSSIGSHDGAKSMAPYPVPSPPHSQRQSLPPGVNLSLPPPPGSANGISLQQQQRTQLPPGHPGHPPHPTIVHMIPRDAPNVPPPMLSVPPPRGPTLGPPPQSVIIVDPRLPPPRAVWTRPPPGSEQFGQLPPAPGQQVNVLQGLPPSMSVPPPAAMMQPGTAPSQQVHVIPGGLPPPGHQLQSSVAHINPAFFPPPTSAAMPPSVAPVFSSDPYGRPPPAVYTSPLEPIGRPASGIERDRERERDRDRERDREREQRDRDRISESYSRRLSPERREREREPLAPQMSEMEFEEILQRNKTVSSSAISRAVQDASSGDYGSAIETLVTAVSLIKQSKIANDDRCKILISSLQDTLHGIELKSYGSKSSSRRSRSPRDREMDRSRLRTQRSRSREYQDRGRDDYRDSGGRDRSRSRSREPYRSDSKRYDSSDRHRLSEREYSTSSRSSRH